MYSHDRTQTGANSYKINASSCLHINVPIYTYARCKSKHLHIYMLVKNVNAQC